MITGLGKRVGPRLRESRPGTPSNRGGEFPQPRAHSLAQLCTFVIQYCVSKGARSNSVFISLNRDRLKNGP